MPGPRSQSHAVRSHSRGPPACHRQNPLRPPTEADRRRDRHPVPGHEGRQGAGVQIERDVQGANPRRAVSRRRPCTLRDQFAEQCVPARPDKAGTRDSTGFIVLDAPSRWHISPPRPLLRRAPSCTSSRVPLARYKVRYPRTRSKTITSSRPRTLPNQFASLLPSCLCTHILVIDGMLSEPSSYGVASHPSARPGHHDHNITSDVHFNEPKSYALTVETPQRRQD